MTNYKPDISPEAKTVFGGKPPDHPCVVTTPDDDDEVQDIIRRINKLNLQQVRILTERLKRNVG